VVKRAEYLMKKGMPFREAHAIVGKIVAQSAANGTPLNQLPLTELKSFCLFSIAMLRKFVTFAARWQRGAGSVRRRLKTSRRRLRGGTPVWALKNEFA
jgi:argininosuccinate lyase